MELDDTLDEYWEPPELTCPFCDSEDVRVVEDDLFQCNECKAYFDENDTEVLEPIPRYEEPV